MIRDTFDPNDIQKQDMRIIADHINQFFIMKRSLMVIPKELLPRKDEIKRSMKLVSELLDLLEKGKIDKVFKDEDDWNQFP